MPNPSVYRVELRNKTFDLVKVLTPFTKKVSWGYDRIGGCGTGTINLSMDAEELQNVVRPDYEIQVWLETHGLVYRGYLEGDTPAVKSKESIKLSISGYITQLKRIRVNNTYTSDEVSVIVKHILDTYVVPNTSITYDSADIEATGFTPDSLEFDCMADSAMETLAGLAGNYEWGVDRNRKFFFKARDNDVRHYAKYKIDIDSYDTYNDYSNIKNRLYIKGGDVGGSPFEATVNNAESQASYGLREKIVSNSAIVSSAVAQRYGTMILADKARIHRRASLKLKKSTQFFEDTTPIGRIKIVGENVVAAKKYGAADAIYGQFKYGGDYSLEFNSRKYDVGDQGLKVNINAGFAKPHVALQIGQLQYEINQLRNV